MTQAAPREDPLASPSILISLLLWYFRQGWLSILSVPLFLFLAYGIYTSITGGLIIFIALERATNAVFGTLLAMGLVWIFVLIASMPLDLYIMLLIGIPWTWRPPRADKVPITLAATVGILILFAGLAELVFIGDAKVIAWIADRNPCATARASITGNIVPSPGDCD